MMIGVYFVLLCCSNVNKTGCGGTGTCGGSYEYISALRTVVKFATRLGNSEDVAAYTGGCSNVSVLS